MDLYNGSKSRVRTVGDFPVEMGLHQRSTISPFLFSLVISGLTQQIQMGSNMVYVICS